MGLIRKARGDAGLRGARTDSSPVNVRLPGKELPCHLQSKGQARGGISQEADREWVWVNAWHWGVYHAMAEMGTCFEAILVRKFEGSIGLLHTLLWCRLRDVSRTPRPPQHRLHVHQLAHEPVAQGHERRGGDAAGGVEG